MLPRLLAGDRLTRRDITSLGHGGLLEDVPERPLPRRKIADELGAPASRLLGAAGLPDPLPPKAAAGLLTRGINAPRSGDHFLRRLRYTPPIQSTPEDTE